MTPRLRTGSALWLMGVLLLTTTRAGTAQIISGMDPYDPWTSMYRPFIFPTGPISAAVPNQGRLNTIGGIPGYVAPYAVGDPFGRFTGSRFGPDYRGGQILDTELKRVYRPNANDTFYQGQEERDRRYFEALRQPDPKKRAEMLKAIERENLQAIRESSAAAKRRAPARTPPSAAAPAATGPAGTAPPPLLPRTGAILPAGPDNPLNQPTPLELLRTPTPVAESAPPAGPQRPRVAQQHIERRRGQRAANSTPATTTAP